MLNFGAGDILEIAPAQGGRPLLLPFTKAVVPVVDIAGGASSSMRRSDAATRRSRCRRRVAGDGRMSWSATVLTLYPEMFPGPLGMSLAGKALQRGVWSLEARDIREHGLGAHRAVDDTPAGGGAGMVMRADVLAARIDAARRRRSPPAPADEPARQRRSTQARVRELAAGPGAVIVCGRFEGVDERVIEARGLEEVSIGDYVLSGGEIAAHGADRRLRAAAARRHGQGGVRPPRRASRAACSNIRITPGRRSWRAGRSPKCCSPATTRKIAEWRRAEAERLTRERRPDLLASGRVSRARLLSAANRHFRSGFGSTRPAPSVYSRANFRGQLSEIAPAKRRIAGAKRRIRP